MHRNLNDLLIRTFLEEEFDRLRRERPRASFLDLGCGDLRYKDLSDAPGWTRLFADVQARAPGVMVECDAHSLPFVDESFDVVLMAEVLEHLRDADLALAEIARVMRPGGSLVLTVPFLWGVHEAPHDYRRFTEFGLVVAMEKAGFSLQTLQRRANLIGTLLAHSEILFLGAHEWLARRRALSTARPLIRGFGWAWVQLSTKLYLRLFRNSISRRHSSAGEGLKGVEGQLAAWPLGLHAVCVRRTPPEQP